MTTTTHTSGPRSQQRRLRNDALILDASVRLAADEGWAGLTPGHVADVTGLSRPTVLERHADRVALGLALWEQRLWIGLRDALEPLIALVDGPEVDGDDLFAVMRAFIEPAQHPRASLELLMVSTYVPALEAAVDMTFGRWMRARLQDVPDEAAARRCLIVGLAFGYLLEVCVRGGRPQRLRAELAVWAQAFCAGHHALQVPDRRAVLPVVPKFDTGDSTWDSVLNSTFESVSQMGYEAATIEVIASRSGFTRTVIFRRYPSKYDLFLDASTRTLGPLVLAIDGQRQTVAEEFGTGVSDAWVGRELMRLELRRLRTILLEQVRLATHSAGLRDVVDDAQTQPERPMSVTLEATTMQREQGKRATELALTFGMLLLSQLCPQIWALPFAVVVVPWRRAQDTR